MVVHVCITTLPVENATFFAEVIAILRTSKVNKYGQYFLVSTIFRMVHPIPTSPIHPCLPGWKYMYNEGTKVQNPRRLCHVYTSLYRPIAKIIYTYNTRQYAYVDKCVSVRGSIQKFGKDESSE